MIRNWETHRCMSRRTRLIALLSMGAAGTASMAFAMDSVMPRLVTAVLLLIGASVVLSIRTCPQDCSGEPTVGE